MNITKIPSCINNAIKVLPKRQYYKDKGKSLTKFCINKLQYIKPFLQKNSKKYVDCIYNIGKKIKIPISFARNFCPLFSNKIKKFFRENYDKLNIENEISNNEMLKELYADDSEQAFKCFHNYDNPKYTLKKQLLCACTNNQLDQKYDMPTYKLMNQYKFVKAHCDEYKELIDNCKLQVNNFSKKNLKKMIEEIKNLECINYDKEIQQSFYAIVNAVNKKMSKKHLNCLFDSFLKKINKTNKDYNNQTMSSITFDLCKQLTSIKEKPNCKPYIYITESEIDDIKKEFIKIKEQPSSLTKLKNKILP